MAVFCCDEESPGAAAATPRAGRKTMLDTMKSPARSTRFIIGILGVIMFCAAPPGTPDTYPPSLTARCVSVIDGDTIRCEIDGAIEKVRLLGINTPERGEPGWKEARDFVKELCLDKDVRIEFDVDWRDRYGRLLGYVFSRDAESGKELFVNKELLRAGRAKYFGFFNMERYDKTLKSHFYSPQQ
jgi:endonuclease YncB( thermonuclease family)